MIMMTDVLFVKCLYVPGPVSALNILPYLILTVPQQGCYYFRFTGKGLNLTMILQIAQGHTANKQPDFEYRRLDSRTHSGIKGEIRSTHSHCFQQHAVIKSF